MSPTEREKMLAAGRACLYDWSLSACEEELLSGFPHVKTIRSITTLGLLEYTDSWSSSDKLAYMHAMLTFSLGTQEQFDALTSHHRALLKRIAHAPSQALGPKTLALQWKRLEKGFRAPRGQLKKSLKRELVAVLGPQRDTDGGEWKHLTRVGEWSVETTVDSGGWVPGFRYEHSVFRGDIEVLSNVTPGLWWGFGLAVNWDCILADDVDGAAHAAGGLCAFFCERLPDMLSGLRV